MCYRPDHAPWTLQPIIGRYAEAANVLSESERCLLDGPLYSHMLRPLCCQQGGRYGCILITPALWSTYKVSVLLFPWHTSLTEQAKANFKEYLLLFVFIFPPLALFMLLFSLYVKDTSVISHWLCLLLLLVVCVVAMQMKASGFGWGRLVGSCFSWHPAE